MFLLSSCGETTSQLETTAGVDIDLTAMSSTMVYSKVYDMMTNPTDYEGQTITLEGEFYWDYYAELATTYYFVIINDATGCCPQGLEFVCTDKDIELPSQGSIIKMTGVFEIYQEGNNNFYRITTDSVEF